MPGLSTEPSTVSREVWRQSGEAAEKQSCSQPWRSSGRPHRGQRIVPRVAAPILLFPGKLSGQWNYTSFCIPFHGLWQCFSNCSSRSNGSWLTIFILFLNVYFCLLIGLHWVLVAGSGIFSCMWDLIPWPGIEPGFPELLALNLNPWETSQVSWLAIFKK